MPEVTQRVVVAKDIYSNGNKDGEHQKSSGASLSIDILGQFIRRCPSYTLEAARKLPYRIVHELLRQSRREEISQDMMKIDIALSTGLSSSEEYVSNLKEELMEKYDELKR